MARHPVSPAIAPEAAALLARLLRAPATGVTLARESGLDPDSFAALTETLWAAALLRGTVADGCCNDPCGSACVSAGRADQIWLLTRKGESTARRLGARDGTQAAATVASA